MLSGCKMYFGSRYFEKYLKGYEITENFFAKFDEGTGMLECMSKSNRSYPFEKSCTQNAVHVDKTGSITISNSYIGFDNCHEVINEFKKGNLKAGTIYSKKVKVGTDTLVLTICFSLGIEEHTVVEECPTKYRDYKIDTRNFIFRRQSTGGIKNKAFFRSPTLAQYEKLLALNHDSVKAIDDYSYSDHVNDYE
jgi:hypothetical protein